MKVSLIQMNVAFGMPRDNFEKTNRLLLQAKEEQPDVIVLPELWNTGFFPKENLYEMADDYASETRTLCAIFSVEKNVNVLAGSVTERRQHRLYNASYAFDRNGSTVGQYDKMHLFSPMGENAVYTPGDHLGLFQFDGVKCGVEICYDIRFPELTRAMALKGLDVLFQVAQWPVQRLDHLHTLAKARAIENQCFVCVCNGCGIAPGTQFGGGSRVFSPTGKTLAMADGTEQIISADLDLTILPELRNEINVFNDRRKNILEELI